VLTIVEKVLLLQEVDIFKDTSTENLSHIAAITVEVPYADGETIYKEDDLSDSMYVIVNGKVRLHRGEMDVMIGEEGDVFGSWALFDDEPRVASATAIEECKLLRIDKEDFYDLLADHSQITQSILKTLSKRLRNLIGQVSSKTSK
jgi:CRP/FNR family cyclic AMP-dependent transcriptional regulator